MSQYVVTDTELEAVADAIRSKGGTEADLEWPSEFVSAIGAMTTGGGDVILDKTEIKSTSGGTFLFSESVTIPKNGQYQVTAYSYADNLTITINGTSQSLDVESQSDYTRGYNQTLTLSADDVIAVSATGSGKCIASAVVVDLNGGSGGGSTNILSGTDTPTSSVGSDGSIYLQYEEYEELPSGYTALEYVQFAYGTYINTGIAPTNHFVEMQVKDLSYGNDKHWFGTDNSSSHPHFTTYSNKYYWGTGSTEKNGGSWSSGVHKLEFNKGSSNAVIIDDITLGSESNISSTSIILIGRRTSAANAENLQVYYFKMRDRTDDSLVIHLVPAKDSNNVIGFYDLVSETFFTNAGTGTFISGPEIHGKPIVSTYLKVDGAWQSLIGSYIDDVDTGGVSI